MITVNQIGNNILELTDNSDNLYAKINLNAGASLQELKIDGKQILAKMAPMFYKDCYNSAILFPFANRVEDGKYFYNNKKYQLEINEVEYNNALHGLVFNKKFQLKSKEVKINTTSVVLEYIESTRNTGFPFTYTIQLTYTISLKGVSLEINIKNTDTIPFPFTLGWHPYFYSSNLEESSIHFHAVKKVIHNKKMITKSIENSCLEGLFELENQNLDDCFKLKKDFFIFKTPEYNLELTSSLENNYLQIYTPNNKNAIAIEPLSGISNSFNNNEGLQILEPNAFFSTIWSITKIN